MIPPTCDSIWVVDFEYTSDPGERPRPVCLVALELRTGEEKKVWLEGDAPGSLVSPPYPTGKDSLFVCFYAPAEMSCHLALGWQMPVNLVDLFVEHRVATNGLLGVGNSLLAACEYHGVAAVPSSDHKNQMRELILAGGPYSEKDKTSILDYCAEDVRLTADLFQRLQDGLDLPRALFRGMYQEAVSHMEHRGIPLDKATLDQLKLHWRDLQVRLIGEIDTDYRVYDGTTFKSAEFERYLSENEMSWPRTETGRISLSDDVFKDMVKTYPSLQGLRDLRHLLGTMKLNSLAVGVDGRNRAMLSPFRSKTGRNQPSSAKYIFGPAVWLRSLIQPEPGRALIYADYEQQEFGIAGFLSGDKAMADAYQSGDPYMSFAKLAGAAPPEATKASHKAVRDLYKVCALAVQFGMGSASLARQMNRPPAYAEELLRQHKRVFKTYWDWSDKILTDALLSRRMTTAFGWKYWISGDNGNAARTIRNWPIQSTGSDILRMACVLLERNGVNAVGPVHDAILVECSSDEAEKVAKVVGSLMERASSFVLGEGRSIRVEHKIINHPDRFTDPRGTETWERVTRLTQELEAQHNDRDE